MFNNFIFQLENHISLMIWRHHKLFQHVSKHYKEQLWGLDVLFEQKVYHRFDCKVQEWWCETCSQASRSSCQKSTWAVWSKTPVDFWKLWLKSTLKRPLKRLKVLIQSSQRRNPAARIYQRTDPIGFQGHISKIPSLVWQPKESPLYHYGEELCDPSKIDEQLRGILVGNPPDASYPKNKTNFNFSAHSTTIAKVAKKPKTYFETVICD